MQTNNKNILTFSLIGIAAYMTADIFHEVIGHGGGCLIIGQHIDLISSAFFRSSPGSYVTDLSGPIINLIVGLLIFVLLDKRKDIKPLYRFLLIITMAFNFFWFSGTILQSSFSKRGDWTYFISQMDLGSAGKAVLVIAGIAAYYLSIKLLSLQILKFNSDKPEFPFKRSVHYSYIAAAVAAMAAGLFFAPDRINAAKEGLLEMIGSLPLLFMKFDKSSRNNELKIEANTTMNLIICVTFVLFCFTLGRGIF